ncbi:MAG: phosphatase PAP2 family protein [Terricaulis sp.]
MMIKFAPFALAVALALAAPAHAQTASPTGTAVTRPTVNTPPIIDATALLGPPPSPDSPRQAADRLAMHPAVSPERLAQARADQPWTPWVAMHPVFGDSFTEARLPRTAKVFQDVLNGLSPPLGASKNAYHRPRPFIADPTVEQCDTPDALLTASGSYPSGHSGGGWAWALVLAELVPARADAILQRGRDFGDSRVICGFHFPSDIEAGRTVASAVIARMHADASFRRDLDAARAELARAYPAPRAR